MGMCVCIQIIHYWSNNVNDEDAPDEDDEDDEDDDGVQWIFSIYFVVCLHNSPPTSLWQNLLKLYEYISPSRIGIKL